MHSTILETANLLPASFDYIVMSPPETQRRDDEQLSWVVLLVGHRLLWAAVTPEHTSVGHAHSCPQPMTCMLSSQVTFNNTTASLKHGTEQTENVRHLSITICCSCQAESGQAVSGLLKVGNFSYTEFK